MKCKQKLNSLSLNNFGNSLSPAKAKIKKKAKLTLCHYKKNVAAERSSAKESKAYALPLQKKCSGRAIALPKKAKLTLCHYKKNVAAERSSAKESKAYALPLQKINVAAERSSAKENKAYEAVS